MASSLNDASLRCKNCDTELAKIDLLMLATMPPSQQHLAVKEGLEDKAYTKVTKHDNPKGGKSARYCPFLIRCRKCDNHVGNVTHVGSKLLVCYKVDNLHLCNGVEMIQMNKLSRVASRLQSLGVEVIKLLPSGATCQSIKPSEPMKYCDTSGLTYTSQEIDNLTIQNPRNYQRELFLAAMQGNTLIYLPTGSGKTLVAAMVLSCMKLLNPQKFMVFIVDRIPLAYQQSAYFQCQLPHLRVETLTGEMVKFQKENVHQALADKAVDILVLTHQIFLDSLAGGSSAIRLSDISVLIFDEAHHCVGGHPFYKIMNDFYKKVTPDHYKPLVLGLTASPAGEFTIERTTEMLQKLLKNLDCKVTMPVKSDDLVAHVNAPNTSYDEVETLQTDLVILERCLVEHIKDVKKSHIESTPGYQQALAGLDVLFSHFRGALRNLIQRCHEDNSKIEDRTTIALIVGEHIMRLLCVIEISQVLSYKDALVYLNDYINSIIGAISPHHDALRKFIGTKDTFRQLKECAKKSVEEDSMSNRYKCLENRIQQFICRVKEDPTSRGIIFVCMRKTAYKLCEKLRLNEVIARLSNPATFVGHGDGSYDGMSWNNEQEIILRKFKSGDIKLLVSTSVLEEGLDVPICNLVVRFEGAATLRAFVQSRGRASRRPDSEFVIICTGKEKVAAKNLAVKEENMRDAVAQVMDGEIVRPQAQEFECERKRPNFPLSEVKGIDNSQKVMRYTPIVTILLLFFERTESDDQKLNTIINSFEKEFNVEPAKSRLSNTIPGIRVLESEESFQLAFILQPKNDTSQEFRSKDELITYVSQMWCDTLSSELKNVWLHPLLPKTSRKLDEPLHILPANSLCLGTLVTRCHFRNQWAPNPNFKKIKMLFDHSFNMLTVFFVLVNRQYKFEVRYEELEDFVLVDKPTTDNELMKAFFTVKHPPRVYQEVVDDDDDGSDNSDDDGDNGDEDEAIDLSDTSVSDSESFSTDDEYPDVIRNFHDRLVPYHLDEVQCWERVTDVEDGERAWGQCFTYCFRIHQQHCTQLRSLLKIFETRLGKKAFYSHVDNSYGRGPEIRVFNDVDFDIQYTLNSIITTHPAARQRFDESRLADLLRHRNPNVVMTCLEKLRNAFERDLFCSPEKILEKILTGEENVHSGHNINPLPNHCALIKRVVITPTRILVHPPEVMAKNRVLRQYETDDFLCVSIREENLSKLSMGRGSIDLVLDNINRVLDGGLSIAGEIFQFLASSNSQLRNHSCWFVGPSHSPEDMRRWMGDFSDIKLVTVNIALLFFKQFQKARI